MILCTPSKKNVVEEIVMNKYEIVEYMNLSLLGDDLLVMKSDDLWESNNNNRIIVDGDMVVFVFRKRMVKIAVGCTKKMLTQVLKYVGFEFACVAVLNGKVVYVVDRRYSYGQVLVATYTSNKEMAINKHKMLQYICGCVNDRELVYL